MSDPDTGNRLQCAAEEITLTAADIPGAELPEPFEKHTVSDLKWWLLCRGVKVPASMKKKDLIARFVFVLHVVYSYRPSWT